MWMLDTHFTCTINKRQNIFVLLHEKLTVTKYFYHFFAHFINTTCNILISNNINRFGVNAYYNILHQ